MRSKFSILTVAALMSTSAVALADGAGGGEGGLTALGLSGDRTLYRIEAATATVTDTLEVAGVERLLGIDLRPATGQLIGVTADFEIVEIDPETGEATVLSTMDKDLPIIGAAPVIVDFNPMADKLRFMSGRVNHRVDVDSGAVTVDGRLAFDEMDMHAGEPPAIAAAAYVNSFGQPDATAMYDIDSTIVALIQQVSPNDGTLAAIGKLGIDPSETYAFDIATDAAGTNTAWLVAGGALHTVSLEDGRVQESREIAGADGAVLRDITFMTAK